MRFNEDHYRKYYREAKRDGLYCFATRQELGKNGRIEEHPLLGCKFKRDDGKIFTMDSVSIHWINGYYYFATLVDNNGSHATEFIENINSESSMILEMIEDFQQTYKKI
jgi:hypothetical protein